MKELGASQVFDYNSKTVVKDIIAAFQGKTLAGALAIGIGSAEPCVDIVHACNGNKFISMTTPSVSFTSGITFQVVLKLVSSNVSLQMKCRIRHIRTKYVYGTTLKENEVSKVIYEDFLPKALAEGRYVAAPEPYVVGTGLEHVQAGFDAQIKGVSAKKVVVSL